MLEQFLVHLGIQAIVVEVCIVVCFFEVLISLRNHLIAYSCTSLATQSVQVLIDLNQFLKSIDTFVEPGNIDVFRFD